MGPEWAPMAEQTEALMSWQNARTCVYEIYVDDDLVYVGCSRHPLRRIKEHKARSRVPRHALLKIVRWYETHEAALAAEARRIRKRKPPLNVSGFTGWESRLKSSERKRDRMRAEWEELHTKFVESWRRATEGT